MLLRPPTSYAPDIAILTMSGEEREKLRTNGYLLMDKLDKFEMSGELKREGNNWVVNLKAKPKVSMQRQIRRVFGRDAFLLLQTQKFANDIRKYGLEVIEP